MTATDSAANQSNVGDERSTVEDITLNCSDGVKIAAQRWFHRDETPPKRRILCLHGWLDNCSSFYRLAPHLVSTLPDTVVASIDFPGHGLSSHKSVDGPPAMIAEYAYYVSEAVSQLEWDGAPFTLIGHSMGASVALVYAASFPENVDKLVLLEGAGPYPKEARDISKHVRSHIDRRLKGNVQPQAPSIYPTVQIAVETRCATAKAFPGKQYISEQAAYELVRRASKDVEGGIQFLHDPRLKWPSIQYFTPEQTESLYKDTQCETCLLLAHDGMPWGEERTDRIRQLLQPSRFEVLPGSHHFHMDPESAVKVAHVVTDFLAS
jgi:pimeloyl-ACP methyl ester carboxylesterase